MATLLLRPVLVLLALAGCDGGAVDDGSFARLQGTWERTDQASAPGSVQFGPGQDYAVFERGAPVESGLYSTLTGPGRDDAFVVRYMPDGAGAPFYDEDATLDGDRLVLRGEGGAARRYRRVE